MATRKKDLRTCFVEKFLLLTPALFNQVMAEVIGKNEAFINDLNKRQLFAGQNADGSTIEPEYTEVTEFIKRSKGQPFDRVTLNDEGNFYESIFTNVFTNAFEMDASDGKTNALRDKYGDLIFGLSDLSKQLLIERIKPQFIRTLRKRLKL